MNIRCIRAFFAPRLQVVVRLHLIVCACRRFSGNYFYAQYLRNAPDTVFVVVIILVPWDSDCVDISSWMFGQLLVYSCCVCHYVCDHTFADIHICLAHHGVAHFSFGH